MTTEIRTVEPRVTRADAVERTATTSAWGYLRRWMRTQFGTAPDPVRVRQLYYPNYVAYTTVTIPRRFASDRVERFLGGIDGMTGRSGAIDVDLPDRTGRQVTSDCVLDPEIVAEDARGEWRDWVFEYASRKFRPVRRPEFDLDSLERVYVPYWIVEFDDATYAVSGLTRAADPIETIPSLESHYRPSEAD